MLQTHQLNLISCLLFKHQPVGLKNETKLNATDCSSSNAHSRLVSTVSHIRSYVRILHFVAEINMFASDLVSETLPLCYYVTYH